MDYLQIINDSLDYIEDNLSENINSKIIANRFFFSKFHFFRIFRAVTGLSVSEYMEKRRMSICIDLLDEREMNILEVAVSCGLSSHEAFTRKFKKYYGVTPNKYRKDPMKIERFERFEIVPREFINKYHEIVISFEVRMIEENIIKGYINNELYPEIKFEEGYASVVDFADKCYLSGEKGQIFITFLCEESESQYFKAFVGYNGSVGRSVAPEDLLIPKSKYLIFKYIGFYHEIIDTIMNDIYRCISVCDFQIKDTGVQLIQVFNQDYYETREFDIYIPIE